MGFHGYCDIEPDEKHHKIVRPSRYEKEKLTGVFREEEVLGGVAFWRSRELSRLDGIIVRDLMFPTPDTPNSSGLEAGTDVWAIGRAAEFLKELGIKFWPADDEEPYEFKAHVNSVLFNGRVYEAYRVADSIRAFDILERRANCQGA